jgi:hypothetical protein
LVRSCDASSIACRWNSFEVTGERGDERRHCRQPLRRRTLRSGLSIPAAHQRLMISPSPPLHVPGRVARDREHALDAVRVREARGERPPTPSRRTVKGHVGITVTVRVCDRHMELTTTGLIDHCGASSPKK